MKNRRSGAERARDALRARFAGVTDARGYMASPQENLIGGLQMEHVEADLRMADPEELRARFCAVHSSTALAVNCFGLFRNRPEDLRLLGMRGAHQVGFGRLLPVVRGRPPAHPDVWIERSGSVVAIESKLLGYFARKRPTFADACQQMAPPVSDEAWWSACEQYWDGPPARLDAAQLIKLYFGMRLHAENLPGSVGMTLLYLFWEPENWGEIEECVEHRQEVEEFESIVAGSAIGFHWMSCAELWREWAADPLLSAHAARLVDRYAVVI